MRTADFVVREFRLQATPSQLRHARQYVEEAADEFGLDHSARYELVFAVNEAVTNAIKHGDADEAGTIGLRIDTDGDALICSIRDHGRFRDSGAQRDPLAEGGRGFTFMTLLMDDVEVSTDPGGTTVSLHKRRRAEAA